MKTVNLLFAIVLIGGCTPQNDHSTTTSSSNPINTSLETPKTIEKPEEFSIPYMNDARLFGGSSFGLVLQAWYRVGDWNTLLAFTSFGTRKKYGDKKLLDHFKILDFAYTMRLKSQNKLDGDTVILNYEADIIATKKMVRIVTVVENDSVKWVIIDLKNLN